MDVVDWHYHCEVRFGSRWYFTEMLCRIADLKVIENFKTILGVGSGRSFTETLFSKDRFVIASDRSAELLDIAKKHATNTHFSWPATDSNSHSKIKASLVFTLKVF